MKLETFFEKFNQFAEAPNAIMKIRELVLELAVSGKLSSPIPGDSAVLSYKDLSKQVFQLSASLGLRSQKESCEDVDTPFELPEHWRWFPLADIGISQTGTTPSKNDHEAFNGEIPFIKPADIFPDVIRYDNESLTRRGAESGSRLAPAGSLLMVCIGTIGKCNLIDRECSFNQQINSLTPVETIDSRFLLFAVRAPYFQRLAWEKSSSTTIAIINKGKWISIPVPVPPLAEQKRIVAKVDELMELCDRLEAQQQERDKQHAAIARASLASFADAPTPANLNLLFHPSYAIAPTYLRKTILTMAIQGKLVPQSPNDEPADELLSRIAAEKLRLVQTKVIKTESSLEPISEMEALFPIPESWAWLRAGDLCRPISSGSTPDQSVFHPSEGIPYLKVYNIRNQAVDFDYKCQFIDVNHHEERMKRSKLLPGDVIMNIVGPPLGKVAIVPATFAEWNCNQAIAFLRPIFPEVAPYLYTFLKEGSFLQNIHLIGTAGQDNISVTKCKFIPISIPPIAEQRRIVSKVDQLMALVDQLESQLAASRVTAIKLMEAVVAELTTAQDNSVSPILTESSFR